MSHSFYHFKISKANHPAFKNNLNNLNESALEEAKHHGCNRINLISECEKYWYYKSWYQTEEENLKII